MKSSTGTVITSDRATYDKNANIVKLFGNVVLKKDANVINGEYMLVDLNEENALIDSPIINIGCIDLACGRRICLHGQI